MVRNSVLAGALACMMVGYPAQQMFAQDAAQNHTPPDGPKPQGIPDAPRPQGLSLSGTRPGMGTTPDSNGDAPAERETAPRASLPQSPTAPKDVDDGPPPEIPEAGHGADAFKIRVQTNFVEVPFTVKDHKGQPVAGLLPREIRVYENGLRQLTALFTVDPFPLSVAVVIDQSMTYDNMTKVNNALSALQGAFTPYDEVAVFTYNNGPQMRTDFTAGQSPRLAFTLERSKSAGRDVLFYDPTGPLGQTTNINGRQFDPNTSPVRNQNGITLNVPKEVHTLNDAILAAAVATSKAGPGRRRVVYVIGDGKEYGSTARFKDVVKYLQTNKVSVYGTLVGDSSLPVIGFLDRLHLPLMMKDNLLASYVDATGGQLDAQFRQKGIETSFAKIAEEVRTQYTIGYYTHQPFIDGKYRPIYVTVSRPNLEVIAKKGYYPTASDARPSTVKTVQ